ncbi:hypothetical protein PLESTF_000193600 [Pleodorina starrii]|nr:hypothetical protein PLESTF_000193600 [Pleodorina starrii]
MLWARAGLRQRLSRTGGAGEPLRDDEAPGGRPVGDYGDQRGDDRRCEQKGTGSTFHKVNENAKERSRTSALSSRELRFRAWFIQQIAIFDALAWAFEFLLLALPTMAHGLGQAAGCGAAASGAGMPHGGGGGGGPGDYTCPDCGPAFTADATALASFPCGGSNWEKLGHTLRFFRGHVVHAVVRSDLSLVSYLVALTAVAALTLRFPAIYLRHRHSFVLAIRLAMAFGNTAAAAVASDACLAATTAPYYVAPHVAAMASAVAAEAADRGTTLGLGGGGSSFVDVGLTAARMAVNRGLFYVALKAVVWGRVLLSYQLLYGMVEWLNGTLVGYVVAHRLYGSRAAAAALNPALLLLQLLSYYVVPCVLVWALESTQRSTFRRVEAARRPTGQPAAPSSPGAAGPSGSSTSPSSSASASSSGRIAARPMGPPGPTAAAAGAANGDTSSRAAIPADVSAAGGSGGGGSGQAAAPRQRPAPSNPPTGMLTVVTHPASAATAGAGAAEQSTSPPASTFVGTPRLSPTAAIDEATATPSASTPRAAPGARPTTTAAAGAGTGLSDRYRVLLPAGPAGLAAAAAPAGPPLPAAVFRGSPAALRLRLRRAATSRSLGYRPLTALRCLSLKVRHL